MDNENLIELVKQYKLLYDLSDKKYSDNQRKDQAWNVIGMKLKRNGQECKKAWALLRDAFRRTVKKRKKTKSQPGVIEKKWKYEDEMSFLLPYMKERPPTGIIRPILTIAACDHDDSANEEAEEMAQSPDFGQQMTVSMSTSSLVSPWSNCIKQEKNLTKEEPSTVLMEYGTESKKITQPDDIEQFMAGITTTLRSFSPRDRAIAKAKIFETVSYMEIEILSRPSTSNNVTNVDVAVKCEYDE